MTEPTLCAPEADARSEQLDRTLVAAFLENIPDYVYFKDRNSRFIALSHSLIRHFGGATAAQIIGRTDFDFFAANYARPAYEDEQRIIATGQPILNKLERETRSDGSVHWMLTNKLPLRNEQGEIIGTFGLSRDVTQTREIELALERAHKALVDASRSAGMAEVATGVLHNVGNVLNSLNVSASVIASGLRLSKAASLSKLSALLREHQGNLDQFLTHDPKGRRVPEFLTTLARHAVQERDRLVKELSALQKNIDHIKEIVSMQQAYATLAGSIEPLDAATLVNDALHINAGSLMRHDVKVVRDFQPVPDVLGEKAKILQILVNLIRNAKLACDEAAVAEKTITLRITPGLGAERVRLVVQDNGVGIPWDNLTRIFGHGFTTRPTGHGFGLHSSANAAREMKGSLGVYSAGQGHGATFTLELPAAPARAPAG